MGVDDVGPGLPDDGFHVPEQVQGTSALVERHVGDANLLEGRSDPILVPRPLPPERDGADDVETFALELPGQPSENVLGPAVAEGMDDHQDPDGHGMPSAPWVEASGMAKTK